MRRQRVLCSRCSEPIYPIVAVDIDGTLGDYHGHFLKFAADYLGRLPRKDMQYTGDRAFSNFCEDAFKISLTEYRAIKLAYRQGAQKRSMPIFYGAKDLCETIILLGAELWLTTTRPYLSLDTVVPDTEAWLERHRITYTNLLFDEDKYKQLRERVDQRRVVVVLDDLPEMLHAAEQELNSSRAVLMMGKYNTAVQSRYRTRLTSAPTLVASLIKRWRIQYDN
jgi:phosphoglycolate phosphatase-like HAD superfamily hydrolase